MMANRQDRHISKMYSMPYDDSAVEKNESGTIRSGSVGGNAILHK